MKGKYFYIIAWGQGTLAFKYSASLNLGFSYVLACLHAPHLLNSVSVITHIFPLKKPKFLPKVIQNCEIYMCSKSDRTQSWFVPGQMRFFSQVCWTFFLLDVFLCMLDILYMYIIQLSRGFMCYYPPYTHTHNAVYMTYIFVCVCVYLSLPYILYMHNIGFFLYIILIQQYNIYIYDILCYSSICLIRKQNQTYNIIYKYSHSFQQGRGGGGCRDLVKSIQGMLNILQKA